MLMHSCYLLQSRSEKFSLVSQFAISLGKNLHIFVKNQEPDFFRYAQSLCTLKRRFKLEAYQLQLLSPTPEPQPPALSVVLIQLFVGPWTVNLFSELV